MKGKEGKPIVDSPQPFGEVRESTMHPGEPIVRGSRNSVSSTTEIYCNKVDTRISNEDKAPGARAHAMRNASNPFAFTGMPKK